MMNPELVMIDPHNVMPCPRCRFQDVRFRNTRDAAGAFVECVWCNFRSRATFAENPYERMFHAVTSWNRMELVS